MAGGLCSRFATAVLLVSILGMGVVPGMRADSITRWVDDKGHVHFSNQPQNKNKSNKKNNGSPAPKPHDWTGRKGKKTYSDRSPKKVQADRQRIQSKMACMEGITEIISGPASTGSGRVVLLTATWCESSKKARAYLKKNRIRFIEYDIDRHRAGRVMYEKLPRRGVPVIIAGNQKMFGFRADLAAKVLFRSGHYPAVKKK